MSTERIPDDTPTLAWSPQDLRDQLAAEMAADAHMRESRLPDLIEQELGR